MLKSFLALADRKKVAQKLTGRLAFNKRMQDAFDADFYRFMHPSLRLSTNQNLFKHYCETGWRKNFDPSVEFSVSEYLSRNPDVREAGIDPLSHYIAMGRDEGRNAYLSLWGNAAASVIESHYLEQVFKEIDILHLSRQVLPGIGALSDRAVASYFLVLGDELKLSPIKNFDTEAYLEKNPDVAENGRNSFLHFILIGRSEGRKSYPEAPATQPEKTQLSIERQIEIIRPFFDAGFYRRAYPDMATVSDQGALEHFVIFGWRKGRGPAENFSMNGYLQDNPNLASKDVNPFLIYLDERSSAAENSSENAQDFPMAVNPTDLDAVRTHFDADYYRSQNPDLIGDDEQLLVHFMQTGWLERRDPNLHFSVQFYLENYPDISMNLINPFLHFILFGRAEGRRPRGDEPMEIGFNPNAHLVPDHLSSAIWNHIGLRTSPPLSTSPASMDIHWIIPDFSRGSGRHMTIFRMIRHLESFGHRCHIWIENPVFHKSAQEAWENIVKHFQCVQASVEFVENGLAQTSGDAVIATGWSTAYLADRLDGFAGKFYFVQDHEPEFYPTGTEHLLAKATYSLDLDCICASPWLEQIMKERYGRWARHFFLAYNQDVYRIHDNLRHKEKFAEKLNGPLRIAVYARDHTARRCVYLALMALQIVGSRRQDFEVHFFGQEDLPFCEANFRAMNHGILSAEQLAHLYNDCHIGICFSATNYSLVPQEMMACGLPLIEIDAESTQAIFQQGIVTLGGPNPFDFAAKLEHLMDSPEMRQTQSEAAREWVARFSWLGAAEKVESAIKERLAERTTFSAPAVSTTPTADLDVVIPTYNGIGELEPVIEALRKQHNRDAIRVHCIDSSSTDGTTEWLRKQPDISTTVIDQKTFQHGRTRNQGAGLGDAPIIAFLTQDAIPTNATWASDILKMFHHVPGAAGLFGRHQPYPDHPEFVRQEITGHFANMLKHPLVLSKATDPEKWASGDLEWRQLLHFYSDNNSAMRRSIWRDIPYPEVDYGEDQVWARDIIEAGHAKLYAPTACVFHSHDYTPDETYKRSRTEGAFFYRHFGYLLGARTQEALESAIRNEQRQFRTWAVKHKNDEAEITLRLANIAEKHRGLRDGNLAAETEEFPCQAAV